MKISSQKLWYLKNIDVFEGISEEEMKRFSEKIREQDFEPNQVIYTPHQKVSLVYLLKRGEVRLYHSFNGKKVVFDVLGPGSIFGEVGFHDPTVGHFAEASFPTHLCMLRQEDFLEFLKQHPERLLMVLSRLSLRIRELEERLRDRERAGEDLILEELKKLKEKRRNSLFGRFKPGRVHITHEQLAELTGLNRVTVTRLLHRLVRKRKLALERSGIEVL